jgi:hypothetical protein
VPAELVGQPVGRNFRISVGGRDPDPVIRQPGQAIQSGRPTRRETSDEGEWGAMRFLSRLMDRLEEDPSLDGRVCLAASGRPAPCEWLR